MKMVFPVLALLISSACHPSALKVGDVSAKPNPTVNNYNTSDLSFAPKDASEVKQVKQSGADSYNERFKISPEEFKQIDFKNYSYPYKLSYGRRNIILNNGEYEYDFSDDRGWFSLSDVYYVDLTGDGKPEAIVILSHVSCGGSCDGSAALFYIFTTHQHKLKSIWHFETGSLGYGCGLKSFTVKNRKITAELFGRCIDGSEESSRGKFQVKDTTRLTFAFNGRRFVERKKVLISMSERSVLNYEPEISIND
jgi:hypothetical protein